MLEVFGKTLLRFAKIIACSRIPVGFLAIMQVSGLKRALHRSRTNYNIDFIDRTPSALAKHACKTLVAQAYKPFPGDFGHRAILIFGGSSHGWEVLSRTLLPIIPLLTKRSL